MSSTGITSQSSTAPNAAPDGSPAAPVACIGLGNMGLAMATRLVACGHAVTAWNRSPEPLQRATEAGATAAGTPRAAVTGAAHVLVSVADDAALDAVVDGPDGLLAGLEPGAIVLSASTVAPESVIDLARRLAERDAALVDAGVLGNPAHAAAGDLRVYLGGDDSAIERALGLAGALGKEVRHVGGLGAGMRIKLVLNLVMGLEMQILAEAAAIAEGLGLDRADTLHTISGTGFASPVMSFKARRMAADRYSDPDFRLVLMAKDLRLAADQAAAAGVETPMTTAAAGSHAAAVAEGLGDLDCAAISARYQRQGGTQ